MIAGPGPGHIKARNAGRRPSAMPGRFEEDVVISQIACGLRYVNPDGCAAGLPLHHVKLILQKGSGGRSLVEHSAGANTKERAYFFALSYAFLLKQLR